MRRKERQHRCNINAGPSPVGAGFEERNHFSEPQAGWLLAAQQKDDNDDDDKEADRTAANDKDTGENWGG
jgi:hypothetical protein